MTRLLSIEPALELFGSQPVRGIFVGQSGIDAFLIFRIRSVPKMEKKSSQLCLLRPRKRCDAILDFFHAHGVTLRGASLETRSQSLGVHVPMDLHRYLTQNHTTIPFTTCPATSVRRKS